MQIDTLIFFCTKELFYLQRITICLASNIFKKTFIGSHSNVKQTRKPNKVGSIKQNNDVRLFAIQIKQCHLYLISNDYFDLQIKLYLLIYRSISYNFQYDSRILCILYTDFLVSTIMYLCFCMILFLHLMKPSFIFCRVLCWKIRHPKFRRVINLSSCIHWDVY